MRLPWLFRFKTTRWRIAATVTVACFVFGLIGACTISLSGGLFIMAFSGAFLPLLHLRDNMEAQR